MRGAAPWVPSERFHVGNGPHGRSTRWVWTQTFKCTYDAAWAMVRWVSVIYVGLLLLSCVNGVAACVRGGTLVFVYMCSYLSSKYRTSVRAPIRNRRDARRRVASLCDSFAERATGERCDVTE